MLLCALVPLLPVKQTTATIAWPQAPGADGMVTDITAPLVSGAPLALDISIPCQAIATLPADGGLVLSTVPKDATDATKSGLFVRATADVVFVAFRDSVAAVAPRPAVAAGACSVLHIWANVGQVGADFVGIPGAAGTLAPDKKPQVAGVFTDLKVAARTGPVRAHRRRHPIHHHADRPEAGRDGARRHLGGRLDRGARGPRSDHRADGCARPGGASFGSASPPGSPTSA